MEIRNPEATAEHLRRFACMSDAEFFKTYLEPLAPKEIAEFRKLCPDFRYGSRQPQTPAATRSEKNRLFL